ncbi:hypothetical protein [Phyllobacterium chamaecytisi]|uniref:hypothetical protein n=1 Tax=Phyllobacterium chamaecytisi TaxID=2876082 RepID=UPI001CCB2DB6|nr:hypothetical protein [Phyllobacterium sp. KW56]MBZ9601636.1 hypothetical protein [Phyllobacterium sp. KW56]
MVSRLNIEILADGGVEVAAWLYLTEVSDPRPVAHGLCRTGENGLERLSKAFAAYPAGPLA